MNLTTRADLHKLIPNIKEATVAEIGCAECLFTADMLRWGVDRVIAVDVWRTIGSEGDGAFDQAWHDRNYARAEKLLAENPERLRILRGISWEMAVHLPDEVLDMVYIDAGHTYECVANDLKAWIPKVKKGGIIAGHDYLATEYGVRRAVDEVFGFGAVNVIPENGVDASFWIRK